MKRRYNSDEAQQDILNAAEHLFAEFGYGEISTNAIAKHAKVSQSQIHYHFKTKRNLWGAVFQRRFAEYFNIQSVALDQENSKGTEAMAFSIRAYFNFFRNNPQFVKLLGRAQLDNIKGEESPQSAELIRRGISVISKAQEQGRLRKDIAPQFILFGFLALITYWFQSRDRYIPQSGLTDKPSEYDDEYLEFILTVYIKGIAP